MKFEMLERYVRPLTRMIRGTVARAVIKAISDDRSLQRLQVQLLADELHSQVARVQEYGFTSVPLPGAEGIFLAVGGAREHGVIIATDDTRYRPKGLAPGEVCLYTNEGDKIHFKNGQIILIQSGNQITIQATTKVLITAPTAEVSCANAKVTASVKAEVTAPAIDLTAATKISAATPLLEVSGIVSCSGIATGGATPVAGDAVIGGNLKASGNVEDTNGTMQEMRDTYNNHTHPENGTGGGTTSPPNEPMT